MITRCLCAGYTDTGVLREYNEDDLLLLPERGLFAVADGMGGGSSGMVASDAAIKALRQFWEPPEALPVRDPADPAVLAWYEEQLRHSIEAAHQAVLRLQAENRIYNGCATTLVVVLLRAGHALVGHVGDSRVYRLREGALSQRTKDHSLLNEYLKAKQLTPQEIADFPYKNVITRAVGVQQSSPAETHAEALAPGDIYLLCSDGLSSTIPEEELRSILWMLRDDLGHACEVLRAHANRRGAADNHTATLVRVLGG